MAAEKLVEYRSVQHSAQSEASVYLTTDTAHVDLRFDNPLICCMRAGRKIMRVNGSEPFDFLPGETLFVNASMAMSIVFPEAAPERPAECMVIEFDKVELDRIVTRINASLRAKGHDERMELDWSNFAHLRQAREVQAQMDRIMHLYETETGALREVLIESAHCELVLRLLQAQEADLLKKRRRNTADTGLNAVVEAIVQHPEARFTSEELARVAHMSEASLFRHFKARYGKTPARFATAHRMSRAREMLADRSIKDVAHALGFTDVGHFSRVFHETIGETPSAVQRRNRSGRKLH
jgi:AraC-like DNA-binding protein